MANEKRKRQLAIGGLVEDNPLTSGATTLTSAGLAAITGGVASTEHMAIVLDPDGIDGAPEVAYLTALTDGAGSSTIARGQEGTTARSHLRDIPWIHATTLRDIPKIVRTAYKFTSDVTTASTSRIPIDSTNLPFEYMACEVGDIVEVHFSARVTHSGAGNPVLFDFEVDQPTSANVYVGDFPGTASPGSSGFEHAGNDYGWMAIVLATYAVTERGSHGFRPVWRTNAATAKIWGTGVYALPVYVSAINYGPEVA